MFRTDIGLLLCSSLDEPDLKIGITFANFSSSGKLPTEKERLMSSVSGLIYELITLLANVAGMPSYPGLLCFREFITAITSFRSI